MKNLITFAGGALAALTLGLALAGPAQATPVTTELPAILKSMAGSNVTPTHCRRYRHCHRSCYRYRGYVRCRTYCHRCG